MLVTLGGQRVIDNCSLPTNIVSSLCISPAGQNMIYFIAKPAKDSRSALANGSNIDSCELFFYI